MNYNEYFKNEFNITDVNVEKVNEKVLKETLKAFNKIYNKYPQLYDVICSYGNAEFNAEIVCKLMNNNGGLTNGKTAEFEVLRSMFNDVNYCCLTYPSANSGKPLIYTGIIYGSYLEISNYNKIKEYFDKEFDGIPIEHIVFHEFVHALDNCIKFNQKEEVKDIFKKYVKEISDESLFYYVRDNISEMAPRNYMQQTIKESIAEAVAISLCNPNRNKNDIITELNELFGYEINKSDASKFDIHSKYEKVMKRNKEL